MPRIKRHLTKNGPVKEKKKAVEEYLRNVKPSIVRLKITATTHILHLVLNHPRYPPLLEFHLFSILPTEIRLLIWAAAIEPRFFTISTVVRTEGVRITATYKKAPLLHTCVESREVGLKHYTMIGPQWRQPLYFSPVHDIFFFLNYLDFLYCAKPYPIGQKVLPENMEGQVRNLAFYEDDDLWTSHISKLRDWKALDNVFLVRRNRKWPGNVWRSRRSSLVSNYCELKNVRDVVRIFRGQDEDFPAHQISAQHLPVDPTLFPEDSVSKLDSPLSGINLAAMLTATR